MLTKTFSPKELADVVGVSESSIKRWGDAGLIDVTRTAGGHRRIGMYAALRFIREQEMQVVRPDLLGLPDLEALPADAYAAELTTDSFYEALLAGEPPHARGMIVAAYLGGTSPAALFDGPIAGALERLGRRWLEDERGIYEEHVATATCLEAVNQLRLLVPPPEDGAPVALGGAPEQDPYLLPSMMVATVLADAGYRAVNLGPNAPVSTFVHGMEDNRPALVWLAAKAPLPEAERAAFIEQVCQPLQAEGGEVVLGGTAAEADSAAWPEGTRICYTMQDLAVYARQARRAA
ncbi:MAG: MerR family DNA-binding transcriptional regulator [Rhodothermales bacterium]|nr:MerR family DNA-binding transcriptional regulator [Rhodothermales bacterium]